MPRYHTYPPHTAPILVVCILSSMRNYMACTTTVKLVHGSLLIVYSVFLGFTFKPSLKRKENQH